LIVFKYASHRLLKVLVIKKIILLLKKKFFLIGCYDFTKIYYFEIVFPYFLYESEIFRV